MKIFASGGRKIALEMLVLGRYFAKIFAPTARFLLLKVSVNLYSAPQAKILGFSVLYKGKSYSSIHKNHTLMERRRRKFWGLVYLIVDKC